SERYEEAIAAYQRAIELDPTMLLPTAIWVMCTVI
ncbi:MAG: tetratricopeptide repeat protein, partial [Limnothrix sp. CACIAM 69d]